MRSVRLRMLGRHGRCSFNRAVPDAGLKLLGGNRMDAREFSCIARRTRLVAVIRAASADEAMKKAEMAVDIGVELLEVAWTTPDAATVISALKDHAKVVGAGTVLTNEAAQDAISAGAEFVLAPNFSSAVHEVCLERSVVYIPGVFTPQDVATARLAGLRTLKLFPAATGGKDHLKALWEPFPGIEWIPTGGVTWETVSDWLDAGAIAVGMGSALFRHPDLPSAVSRIKGDQQP